MTMQKPSHLRFSCKTFTSDEIDEMLEAGGNFRHLRVPYRDGLLAMMKAGEWEPANGEVIVRNGDGRVLNGQHRLSAAALYQRETNDKVWFWVCDGADESVALKTDCGLPRRVGDYLRHEGVPHAHWVTAISMGEVRQKLAANKHSLLATVSQGGVTGSGGGKRGKPIGARMVITLPMAVDAWKRNKGAMAEWAKIGYSLQAAKLPRSMALSALGYQLAKKHEMKAKLFFDFLVTGSGMKQEDPILMLREKLRADMVSKRKYDTTTIAALLIKTWVAWNEGRKISVLKWARVGHGAENFPSHEFRED